MCIKWLESDPWTVDTLHCPLFMWIRSLSRKRKSRRMSTRVLEIVDDIHLVPDRSVYIFMMSEIGILQKELATARREIQNLRKQITSLTYVQQKDVQNIKNIIDNYQCESCKTAENSKLKPRESDPTTDDSNLFKHIGLIRTVFTTKRAVPRQPTLNRLLSRIEISQNVFNNPEHSLDGLCAFSHMWIIYHFHKNESHCKSKVAPPRLGGSKVGVFSTRSPHRPCPIGLSLVEIERVEENFVYFYGTDMVDGTPVLDVKPYIPAYDFPGSTDAMSAGSSRDNREDTCSNAREEPDGEENFNVNNKPLPTTSNSIVKVPKWINSQSKLLVIFTERASDQINELEVNKNGIEEVLSQDPRSVYLRTKHGSQLFTFQISNVMVSCQFDDENSTVTVVQILKTENFNNESRNDLNGLLK